MGYPTRPSNVRVYQFRQPPGRAHPDAIALHQVDAARRTSRRATTRVAAYDPKDGQRPPATTTRSAAAGAWSRRLSRRVAEMAPSTARSVARAGTPRRLVRAGPVELVGWRMVLGSRAGRGRRLPAAAEPWSAGVDTRRHPVAGAAHPFRRPP